MISESAIWHNLECGSYAADLDCWLALADEFGGPVLDVGAGTGRIALMLAATGRTVTAVDLDPALLATLKLRSGADSILTVCVDAREMELGARYSLIIVPMLTVQLFGGSEGRRRFLTTAAAHLEPGALLAMAIADLGEDDSGEAETAGAPDTWTDGEVVYSTVATSLVARPGQIGIERRREVRSTDGSVREEAATDWIDSVTADEIEAEAVALGMSLAPRRQIPATDEYIGSTVVCLNG
ncbi:MAG: methyltransferase domain-containing protein [Actinobacteria bacterium]|uniref:Unannotated protein n=1 Tax=freshwater metagenome TaxID=449393 RepID=A0A6J5ZQ15_9ZZZZ|nr:methyltransferase domain-containing protein [Actinomycetota bacterium]